MKKIIIILSALLCTCGIYSQTFKDFFANNSIDGNLNSKYYSIDFGGLRVYLSDQNLTDLEGLDIISIQNRSIADFNCLALSLNNNQLTSLPQEISKLTNLWNLNLSNNNLTSLPENFGSLTYLWTLRLSNNNLTSLPENFGSLTNLFELNLSNNNLIFLPDSFNKLIKLQELHLSNNNLTSLPENFGSLTNLLSLNLSNNNLTSLPESFGSVTNLLELNLSNNNLTSLPESFGSVTNLLELNLSNNNLTSLPESFDPLTNLQKLSLNNNRITCLPETLNNLTNLEYLNLNNNPLTTMPLSLFKKLQYSLNDTPLGAALYYRKLKNTGISDSRLQPILVSSFYHNYENEKLNLSDFRSSFALELIKNISSLFKARIPKAGYYNPISRMTLPRTILKEQFNKQRTKKRKIEETESVEYQLPQEIIRNIYTYLD